MRHDGLRHAGHVQANVAPSGRFSPTVPGMRINAARALSDVMIEMIGLPGADARNLPTGRVIACIHNWMAPFHPGDPR